MGRTVTVEDARPIVDLLANEPDWQLLMIDNQLVPSDATIPATWSDVRVRTPAGTLALKRDGARIHVVSFGNEAAMNEMQDRVAAALRR